MPHFAALFWRQREKEGLNRLMPKAITLNSTRADLIVALIGVNILVACTHGVKKEAEGEIFIPPSFTTTPIRMGMPLWEAQAAYPQQKPDWYRPHSISFQFTKWQKVSAAQAGMIALPLGTFHDEKLVYILSIVAFKGTILEPATIDRIHAELLKQCETLYGAEHNQAVTHKITSTGNEYSQIIWNKTAFNATLTLPRIKNQKQTQKLAALEVAAKENITVPSPPVIDVIRALFGKIGL